MDSGIQHKPTLTASSGYGFDDGGNVVPVVSPVDHDDDVTPETGDVEAVRREARREGFVKILSRLGDLHSSDDIGRVALILIYLLKLPNAPRTLEELGSRFAVVEKVGVGKARVSQIMAELKETNPDLFKGLPNS